MPASALSADNRVKTVLDKRGWGAETQNEK